MNGNEGLSRALASVDKLETMERREAVRDRHDDEDAAVAMNAVATIVGRQGRQFFSAHDMKAQRTIKAVLQAIPDESSPTVQVATTATVVANPALDKIADAATS